MKRFYLKSFSQKFLIASLAKIFFSEQSNYIVVLVYVLYVQLLMLLLL